MLLSSIQIQDMLKQMNLEEKKQKQEELRTEPGQRKAVNPFLVTNSTLLSIRIMN
jgi:hypothetical protein